MDQNTALSRVGDHLRAEGFEVSTASLLGLPMTQAVRTQFRWAWLATRLTTIVTVAVVPSLSLADAQKGVDAALEHSKPLVKGIPGAQSGGMVVPVFLCNQVPSEAMDWAGNTIVKRFAFFATPVLVDTSSGQAAYEHRKPAIGRVYHPYRLRLIEGIVGALNA
jgi:hypothetical protein